MPWRVAKPIPPVTLESLLAGYRDPDRDRILLSYLRTVDDSHREIERSQLLRQARSALPYTAVGEAPITVERRVNATLRTPLFEFSAPEVPGCEVSLQTYTAHSAMAQWEVALGIGGGTADTMLTSLRATFIAGAGEHKRVFLPVQAIAIRRYIYRQRYHSPRRLSFLHPSMQPVSDGFDEIEVLSNLGMPVPGVESVRLSKVQAVKPSKKKGGKGRLRTRARVYPLTALQVYRLAGDRTKRLAHYEHGIERSRTFHVTAGGSALGIHLSAGFSVTLVTGLVLKFVLTPGHDYYQYSNRSRPGILWRVGP
jgi:hypothetical protein